MAANDVDDFEAIQCSIVGPWVIKTDPSFRRRQEIELMIGDNVMNSMCCHRAHIKTAKIETGRLGRSRVTFNIA